MEKLTYEDIFYRTLHHRKKGKPHSQIVQVERERNYGFPYDGSGMGWCHELKNTALSITNLRIPHQPGTMVQLKSQAPASTDFQSQSTEGIGVQVSSEAFSDTALAQGGKINIVQYLGIAADEPKRIERHQVKGKMLPLVDIGWSEAYCRKWCEEHDLLSPIYTTATRGGCWFCHNQGVDQLRQLRKNYPDLWALLLKWDLDSPTTFHADGHTVHDFDKRFRCEDEGIIDPNATFRWAMISDEALATKQISMFREEEREKNET